MRCYYYLGWFNHYFPEKLSRILQEDIVCRKSIVFISSNPMDFYALGAIEKSWLDQAEIRFDTYFVVNYQTDKERAHKKIKEASVVFLLGGSILNLKEFIDDYELKLPIIDSGAHVLGASAGAINMSAKWMCSKKFGDDVERNTLFQGLGLNDFSIMSHFDLENNMDLVLNELDSLSNEIEILASNKDCAIRIKNGERDIIGDVFSISKSKVLKLKETL